ncbi:hypothetical protein [Clostridium sp. HBUAS56017]|uniref:hypothetical protein n=1 Tax=Clostridium sp. HBUAS56017 TaxID=2571128 RepID=UPI0011787B9D|nr:hypothetical protein [Clostridium sp. HBUAS56017]
MLNEDNSVDNLIENVKLIKNIYENTNKLIGNDEELKYKRLESGSLLLILSGSAVVFKAIKPMLEFGYKIYTEQFGQEAKTNRKLKEIKVRKEYLTLLFKATGVESVKELKEQDRDKLLKILLNLESDIKELYTLNPCINVNDIKLGETLLENSRIPIELLESAEIAIDDLV